jgi:hypothetical protein
MGVTVDIAGGGHLYGGPAAISGYGVVEDATPVSPSDSTGGTGSFTIKGNEAARVDGTLLLLGNWAFLTDGSNGIVSGMVNEVDVQDGDVELTIDSRLNLLVTDVQVLPFTGTLGDALLYYFGLARVTYGIVIDPDIARRAVSYVGWKGSIWDNLKQICSAEQIEIALVNDNVVVRPLRVRNAVTYRDSTAGVNAAKSATALTVGIYNYNAVSRGDDTCAYPIGAWDESVVGWQDEEILTVNAGETQEYVVELSASLKTVAQPVYSTEIPALYRATSIYSVVDQKGVVIGTTEWLANGGFLTVVINPDTTSLTITIRGAQLDADRAPFRVAMNDTSVVLENDTDQYPVYSSLRIVGTGTFYRKELHTFSTSADPLSTSTTAAPTIDSPFITDYDKLFTAASYVMGEYAGSTQTLTVTTYGINRVGVTGSTDYMTFGEYDKLQSPTDTLADFDALWDGKQFSDFDFFYDSLVEDEFKNQAFGNVAGARVRHGMCFYRINHATFTEASVSYTAVSDTTIADFDAEWDDNATFEDFDNQWTTKSFSDFDRIPLWANGIGPAEEANIIFPSN